MIKPLILLSSLATLAIGVSSAAVLLPVGIEGFHQGDGAPGNDGSITRAIDGSGMTQPDAGDPSTWTTSGNAWQDDWQGFAPPATDTTWAVLDLGGATSGLDQMYLWNVNEGSHSDRGTNLFNIWYATAPTVTPPATTGTVTGYSFTSGGWSQLGGTETLTRGSEAAGLGPDAFDVSGASGAQYIGLEILSNHGAGDRVGFAEVAFTTIPEPGSIALLLVGAVGMLRRRR